MTKETEIERLTGFDPSQIYAGHALGKPGEGDLFMDLSTKQVIGRATIFLQLAGYEDDKLPRFNGITVIAPPEAVWGVPIDEVREYVAEALMDIRKQAADLEELSYIESSVSMIRCNDLSIDSLVKTLKKTGGRELIFIVEASRYRDQDIQLNLKVGQSTSWSIEDEWVPHMARLASLCLQTTLRIKSYVVFIASHHQPISQQNRGILNDVEGLYPYFTSEENDGDQLLHEYARDWIAKILQGNIDDVLAEIEAASIHPDIKTQLSIQFIARSGDYERAAQLIRYELEKGMNHPPDVVIRFARLSEKSGDTLTGSHLRERVISSVNDRHLLEETLLSATDLDNAPLIQSVYVRLSKLFPASLILKENRELRILRCCQMTVKRADLVAYCSGFGESYQFLVQSLFDQHAIKYHEILSKVSSAWPADAALAAYCCALHAQVEELPLDAIKMAVQVSESRYASLAATIVLTSVRRMMLKNSVPREQIDSYKLPLRYAINYLANHPSDAKIRNMLISMLSVETCGAFGLPLIISLTLDIVEEGAPLETDAYPSTIATKEEFSNFLPVVMEWMRQEKVIELGVSVLPADIAGENSIGLINYLSRLIQFSTHATGEELDLQFLDQCVHIVCLLAPHAGDQQSDLQMLRVLASKYSLEGHHQKARDIAEQILLLADSRQRNRIAWTAFADIYQRTRGRIEALIGLSCAAATQAPIDLASIWHEAFALLRMTRDMGLHEIASTILATCKELSDRIGLGEQGRLKLTTIELGLKFAKIGKEEKPYLSQLLVDTVRHCEKTIDLEDELIPIASLLTQLVPRCEEIGISIDNSCQTLLRTILTKLGPATGSFLQAISSITPTSEDVLLLQRRVSESRFSDDAANDMAIVVMAARRLLRSSVEKKSALDVCFALEVLSEKSIEIVGKKLPVDIGWPASYMKQLSSSDTAVTLIALTDLGDLVTATSNGSDDIILTNSAGSSESFVSALNRWTVDYPFKYGIIDRKDGNNEFYQTMEDLTIPLSKAKNILVVPDPSLQQVPMNLVILENEFLGRSCAVGTAPSLEWLHAIRTTPSKHDGRRLAWISASNDPEEFKTLEVALGRLEPTLNQFGFIIDTARKIPSNLSGAQMVVVTAHGSLTTESRFIQRISDEGTLAESPMVLARALAGVEIVILFVCSGGRLDRHPHMNTTVGLPKLLLDRGSRVVIASPWPLTILVTYRWLESFMTAWDAGDTVLDATFKGNASVLSALGDPPQYSLAMTVHGDVFLRKS